MGSQTNYFNWEYIWIFKLGTNLLYYLYKDCYQSINFNSLILLILSSKLVLSIIYLQLLPTIQEQSITFIIFLIVNSYLLLARTKLNINFNVSNPNYLIILYAYINTLIYIFILLNRESQSNFIQEYVVLDVINLLVISYFIQSNKTRSHYLANYLGLSWILSIPPIISYYYKLLQYCIVDLNLLFIIFNHIIISIITIYYYRILGRD